MSRKTQEEFKKEVFDLVGDSYSVLGEYKNTMTKIKMKHNCIECNNFEWEIFPNNFLRGCRCPKCAGNARKTQEEFEEEIYNLTKDEYSILGEYKDSKTKIKMKHNICGYEYEVQPNSFLRGSRCPECFGTPKKTQEEFEREVYDLTKDEYEVLGDYKDTATKIKMRHNCDKCNNYEWDVKPNDFLRGSRCPKCFGNAKKKPEEFKKEVFDLVGEEYTLLEEYVDAKTRIKIRHNCERCNNYEYKKLPNDFLRGDRCPKCSTYIRGLKRRKTIEEFKQEVFNLEGDKYSVLGQYKNARTKIKMKHNVCSYEYEVTPDKFLNGGRCPKCNESKGEVSINNFLNDRKISYEKQYMFRDCRNTRPLPFDFAIFDEKGNIKLLIEYQGEQHYMNNLFFFKDDSEFVNRITIDCKKRAYCEYNNIPLLEIPYTDYDNIESILIDALNLKN